MRSKLLLYLLLGMFFFSCNKLKQTEKRIVGNWIIVGYNYVNFDGFTTEFDGTGEFIISNLSSSHGDYSLNLQYQNLISSGNKIESGKIQLNQNGENYRLDRINPNGTITSNDSGTIKFLNKTQMETFFNDEFGTHYLVLSKD